MTGLEFERREEGGERVEDDGTERRRNQEQERNNTTYRMLHIQDCIQAMDRDARKE